MRLLGIDLRKPTFGELTAAAVMALGLWLALLGLARASGQSIEAHDAGALLVVVAWGCIGTRLGLALDQGRRHALVNVCVSAVLLGTYQGALAFAG